jgi:hypothetical protein
MLPIVANGIPLATAHDWVMVVMNPESGGPAAPGLRITAQPTVTGGPDISFNSD